MLAVLHQCRHHRISRMSIAANEEEAVRLQAKHCIVALLLGELDYMRKRPLSMREIPLEEDE